MTRCNTCDEDITGTKVLMALHNYTLTICNDCFEFISYHLGTTAMSDLCKEFRKTQ